MHKQLRDGVEIRHDIDDAQSMIRFVWLVLLGLFLGVGGVLFMERDAFPRLGDVSVFGILIGRCRATLG